MSIPEVATIMQALLGPKATELALKTGFVQTSFVLPELEKQLDLPSDA